MSWKISGEGSFPQGIFLLKKTGSIKTFASLGSLSQPALLLQLGKVGIGFWRRLL